MTGGNSEHGPHTSPRTPCDEAAVRTQLDKILTSSAFAGSPQLRAFLSYIVDQRLKGNESRIKGYTIAVEALGRAASFDPAADPIIRVEAARLRRLIGDYYAGPGADDPVLIDVPKGGYVPVFKYRETDPARTEPAMPPRTGDRRRMIAALAASAVVAAGLAVFVLVPRDTPTEDAPPGGRDVAEQSGAIPADSTPAIVVAGAPETGADPEPSSAPFFKGDLPRIFVADIVVDGTAPQPAAFSPARVQDNLTAALRLFSEVELSGTAAEADYRVEGRASFADDNASLSFVLVYAAERETVWSALFELTYERNAAELPEERIVHNIASTIARPYGVIFNHAASHRGADSRIPEGFRCVLLTFDSQRSFAPDVNARGRDCLTSLLGRQAGFAPAHALLPMLYVDNARFGVKSDKEREAALAQAFVLARQAAAATPDSARAYQALQTVLLYLGRGDEALEAGRRARRLNPYDTDIMATHASTLIMLGDTERGLSMLQKARRMSPGHPAWYNTMIIFAAYGKGDRDLARKEADLIQHDDTLSGLLARILMAHADGDTARRAALSRQLISQRPEFGTAPAAMLRRIFPSPPLNKRLLAAVAAPNLTSAK